MFLKHLFIRLESNFGISSFQTSPASTRDINISESRSGLNLSSRRRNSNVVEITVEDIVDSEDEDGISLCSVSSDIDINETEKNRKTGSFEDKPDEQTKPIKWRSQRQLIKHARTFVCQICNFKCKEVRASLLHQMKNHPAQLTMNTIIKCPECSFVTDSISSFNEHFGKHSYVWPESRYLCKECKYKTQFLNKFKIHCKYHSVRSNFSCKFCSYSHYQQRMVTNHMKLHNHYPKLGMFSCNKCSYTTRQTSCLSRHVKFHCATLKQPIQWFFCEQCPFKTKEKQSLRKHIKHHQRNFSHKCPLCTFSASSVGAKRHLYIHFKKGENIPEDILQFNKQTVVLACPQCKYQTNNKCKFQRHLKVHDSQYFAFACADCPFKCRDKMDLIKHVAHHKGKDPLKCQQCTFTHFSTSIMTKHRGLHEDKSIRKYRKGVFCGKCGMEFRGRSFLKRHMSKHSSLEDFEDKVYCAQCPYTAKCKRPPFINHVQGHNKTDGIKCKYCTYRHNLSSVMTKHTKLHETNN